MFDFLPAGVLGLILTGFIAALMSSIDSALTAASSIATLDIYKKFRPGSSQKKLVKMGKIFILVAVFIGSLWAPFIDQFPTLWEYLQAVLSYLSPPVVTCYLFGLFWRKASANGAFYSLLLGSLFALLMGVNNYLFPFIEPIHYLYSATWIFLFSCAVMVIISYLKPDTEAHSIPASVWQLSLTGMKRSSEKTPWHKSYLTFGIVVVTLTLILVYIFR